MGFWPQGQVPVVSSAGVRDKVKKAEAGETEHTFGKVIQVEKSHPETEVSL